MRIQDNPQPKVQASASLGSAADQDHPPTNGFPKATTGASGGLDHQQTNSAPSAKGAASAGSNHPTTSLFTPANKRSSSGSNSTTTKPDVDSNHEPGGDGQTPRDKVRCDSNTVCVLGPILDDPILGTLAELVDDLEKVRVANENRLRALTTGGGVVDKDGVARGHGFTLQHPDVARLAANVYQLAEAENQAIKNLQKAMRRHPLWAWAKPITGVGEKQLARLLAAVGGDPYWNDKYDRPRTVRELRAYCGFHVVHPGDKVGAGVNAMGVSGVAPKRQRGQQSNWNAEARKRVWLIAAQTVRYDGPYRDIYDAARTKYVDAVHAHSCVRCGPAKNPAQPGTPLAPGHQHARAIRKVASEFLKDLWRAAQHAHHTQENAAA